MRVWCRPCGGDGAANGNHAPTPLRAATCETTTIPAMTPTPVSSPHPSVAAHAAGTASAAVRTADRNCVIKAGGSVFGNSPSPAANPSPTRTSSNATEQAIAQPANTKRSQRVLDAQRIAMPTTSIGVVATGTRALRNFSSSPQSAAFTASPRLGERPRHRRAPDRRMPARFHSSQGQACRLRARR